jgi:hypothetical protein
MGDLNTRNVEAPKVSKPRTRIPNANRILDNVLESVGLQRDDGGVA